MFINSELWQATYISFNDDKLGGEAIGLIATTVKDEQAYFFVAVAEAAEWNTLYPIFQTMINTFRFVE